MCHGIDLQLFTCLNAKWIYWLACIKCQLLYLKSQIFAIVVVFNSYFCLSNCQKRTLAHIDYINQTTAMKKTGFLLILLMSLLGVHAQQISGKVLDDSTNQGMGDVSVTIKGNNEGTKTNIQGEFLLALPPNRNKVDLIITSIGYATLTANAQPGKPITIRLHREVSSMNEVVVIGYGSVKKRDLTGSVVSLKGSELKEVPTTNVLEAAQGKIAGADITKSSGQAGASVNIRIRGNRSIGGNNSPLIIVDGVQYSNIQDINPNDIESMEVLKDASSVAIYGSRGANGVIIITTKRGKKGN